MQFTEQTQESGAISAIPFVDVDVGNNTVLSCTTCVLCDLISSAIPHRHSLTDTH